MEKNNTQKIYKIVMLILIVIIVTSLITAFLTYQYLTSSKGIGIGKTNNSLSGLEYTLSQFRSELEKKYIGEINDEDLIESAIKGYVAGLGDPYTVYYTKEEMEDIMQETNGKYVGIGIYMTLDTEKNAILVLSPIENSPAEEAGLMPGDIITKIDGISYTGDQLDEASNKIKGEEGTKTTIEILRGEEIKTFEIERRKILISHITTKVLKNNIGYIKISDFEGGCADEFREKYLKLEKQGINKLIIDIRDNGGGIVDEALEIAEMITEKGSTLLITTDKNKQEDVTKSNSTPIIHMPIVLLTNEYSASASEILAAALKENEKATLVGTKTYGKGVIQQILTVKDGSGIKLTVEEYQTPNRNKINKIGIEPNETVELPSDVESVLNVPEDKDTQLQKAQEIANKNQ